MFINSHNTEFEQICIKHVILNNEIVKVSTRQHTITSNHKRL